MTQDGALLHKGWARNSAASCAHFVGHIPASVQPREPDAANGTDEERHLEPPFGGSLACECC